MVRLFQKSGPAPALLLFICTWLVHIHMVFVPMSVAPSPENGWLSYIVNHLFIQFKPIILYLFYVLIVFTQAIWLNVWVDSNKVIHQPGYTVALAYILFTGLLPQWASISAALLSNFLMLALISIASSIYMHPAARVRVFNLGLLLGSSILLYEPFILLIPGFLIAIAMLRPFKLQEFILYLAGLLLPYYFLGAGLFWMDEIHKMKSFLPNFELKLPFSYQYLPIWLAGSLLLLFLLVGLSNWVNRSSRMLIQQRKYGWMLAQLLLWILPVPYLIVGTSISDTAISLIPIATFSSLVFLQSRKSWLPGIFFWTTIALVAYIRFLLVKNS